MPVGGPHNGNNSHGDHRSALGLQALQAANEQPGATEGGSGGGSAALALVTVSGSPELVGGGAAVFSQG